VVRFTPPAIASIGWKTYIIFAVFNLCFLPAIYLFYPETKGLLLEDVDRLFLFHPSGMKGMGPGGSMLANQAHEDGVFAQANAYEMASKGAKGGDEVPGVAHIVDVNEERK
jgi:hypothetical protein